MSGASDGIERITLFNMQVFRRVDHYGKPQTHACFKVAAAKKCALGTVSASEHVLDGSAALNSECVALWIPTIEI